MADDTLMNQSEIEKLLSQGAGAAKPAAAPSPGQADIESLLQSPAAKSSAPALNETEKDKLLGQNDIEELLSQAGKVPIAPPPKPIADASSRAASGGSEIPEKDIEYLLNQAERALESINAANNGDLPQGIHAFRFEELSGAPASTETATLDLIRDVELDLKIELGRTQMYLEDVLKLRRGSVVPLDKLAGDPVDIYVNGRLIARGEVLVMNDNFCVRVAELIAGAKVCA
jgi:flagellar motor switch protein FliN